MRNKAMWAVGLVPLCALALVAATPAHPDLGREPAVCVPLDAYVARNLRGAMELESEAVAALQAARVPQAAASAALLETRGDGTGGDPSCVHARNRLTQAIQSARLAESNLARSLDDLAAALAALPPVAPVDSIVLSPAVLNLTNCNETFEMTAIALDGAGTAVAGEAIFFQFVDYGPGSLSGTFDPNPVITDASGNATTTLTFTAVACVVNCTGAVNCSTQIRASDLGGLVLSNVVTIIDQVP